MTSKFRVGALLVVAAAAGVNLAEMARETPPAPVGTVAAGGDSVERHEERLAALAASLRERGIGGTIGYLGDLPPNRLRADAPAVEDYFLAQYSLAPVVLDAGPGAERCPWCVADLRASRPEVRIPPSWRVVEDFGGGVLLLARKRP